MHVFFQCISNHWIQCMYSEAVEKAMAPHSSTLAWKIPWMEEPGSLQSMGSHRVGHARATSLWLFTFMHWRRKWQPTPVFLPGESQGWGSLVGSMGSHRVRHDWRDVAAGINQGQAVVQEVISAFWSELCFWSLSRKCDMFLFNCPLSGVCAL